MMTRRVEAIYEDGVLRLLEPIEGIPDQTKVSVRVDLPDRNRSPIQDCVGSLPDVDADEMRRIIADEFERVDPRDWD